VVKLHDLARDVGLERAIVVCGLISVPSCVAIFLGGGNMGKLLQERSGSVALPRTKLVLAMPKAGLAARARRLARRAVVRRRVEDIVDD
jgi:hypothetical protein